MEIPETVWVEAKAIANDWAMPETEQSCAEAVARAIMAERERAALVAEDMHKYLPGYETTGSCISQAIRNPLHKQT